MEEFKVRILMVKIHILLEDKIRTRPKFVLPCSFAYFFKKGKIINDRRKIKKQT